MKTIHRRLRKLEAGWGLVPETEDEKRLRARLEAGRARLVASGYRSLHPQARKLAQSGGNRNQRVCQAMPR